MVTIHQRVDAGQRQVADNEGAMVLVTSHIALEQLLLDLMSLQLLLLWAAE